MKDIAIVGAGGLGREVAVLLRQINDILPVWNILGFYDDNTALQGKTISGLPYLGNTQQLEHITEPLHVVVGIGAPKVKQLIIEQLESNPNLIFPSIVHPSVLLKPYQEITIGRGVVVTQGNILTTNICIGNHVFINLSCTIGHDCYINDFASIMPGVNLSGSVWLEPGVFVGTNAAILQGLRIGANSKIGAGAVVIKSVPENCTAVGVPAKIVKSHAL